MMRCRTTMRVWLLGIFLLVLFVSAGCSTDPKETTKTSVEENTYRQISMKEAEEMMVIENNYVILDVRTLQEYNEGHIPGAICIPNETIGSEEIPQLPDKDQLILVYCRSGNRSKQASQKLVQLGYTNVVEFGGILDWTGEVEIG